MGRTSYNKVFAKAYVALVLKNWLKENRITKQEFAESLNQKPSVVSKWLSGRHNFTIDTLVEIENITKLELLKN